MVERVVIEADGASRGNPGPAAYGAAVIDPATGAVLAERAGVIGTATNNVAEYRGLIAGLTAAAELGVPRADVRMDSKLVVEQMAGRWQVKHEGLRELAREAVALRQHFDEVTFQWVPREQNKHADRLANEVLDEAAGKPVRRAPTQREQSSSAHTMPRGSWTLPTSSRTRLVLIRHGATEHSAEARFSGRNELALDEVGRDQAERLAGRDFGTVAAVVSSPLRRAVDTAEVIAKRLGHTVAVVDDLVETDFGVWEGLTFAEAMETDPDVIGRWQGSADIAPPGGESFTAVGARVARARAELTSTYPDATVLVVTHVTPIKLLVCSALGAPPVAMFRLYLDTASVSIVDYYADGNASVRLVNDTSHLR